MIFTRSVGANENLYSINADGTGLVTLANSADDEWVGGITSDNRVIVNRSVGGAQVDIYIINADGTGGLNPVLVAPDSDGAYGITSNNRVLFGRSVGGANYDLYSINPDGSGLVVLANSADAEMMAGILQCLKCGFSEGVTSNNRVIFERWTGSQYDLYSINADGTGLATLANTADDEYYYDIF